MHMGPRVHILFQSLLTPLHGGMMTLQPAGNQLEQLTNEHVGRDCQMIGQSTELVLKLIKSLLGRLRNLVGEISVPVHPLSPQQPSSQGSLGRASLSLFLVF